MLLVLNPVAKLSLAFCQVLQRLGVSEVHHEPRQETGACLTLLTYQEPVLQKHSEVYLSWLGKKPLFVIGLHTASSFPVQTAQRLYTFLLVQLPPSDRKLSAAPLTDVLQQASVSLSQLPIPEGMHPAQPVDLWLTRRLEGLDILRRLTCPR